jgi:hypothetical protein
MTTKILITTIFAYSFFMIDIFAQIKIKDRHILKQIVMGANYTYIFDTETINDIDYDSRYNESTLAANIAIDMGKHMRVGIDYKRIYTSGLLSGKNNYTLLGLFTQYKFAEGKNGFGFGELGFYKGNYCTCGGNVPYKKNGLSYLSWGGGYNFKLYKNIRIDAAFTTAQVITKVPQKYGYTQYVLGIDYVLPFMKKLK